MANRCRLLIQRSLYHNGDAGRRITTGGSGVAPPICPADPLDKLESYSVRVEFVKTYRYTH